MPACAHCRRQTPIDLLDGKAPRHDPQSEDFSACECPACYGPGWLPLRGTPVDWLHALYIAAVRNPLAIPRILRAWIVTRT